jgi:histo-blood group ABO system transferase
MERIKIGVLIIATNKYIRFVQPLIDSAKKHLFKNDDVTFYLFTNHTDVSFENTEVLYWEHKPWPYGTLLRYHAFSEYADNFNVDYLYYCDADMLFVDDVDREILPDESGLVGTIHFGFYNQSRQMFTYDRNPKSTACIGVDEGEVYYAGGFNGGTKEAFIKMSNTIRDNIDIDLSNNIIALWHDESHLNKYFYHNPPKGISVEYCYPESWSLPFKKRLLALDKDHAEIRS